MSRPSPYLKTKLTDTDRQVDPTIAMARIYDELRTDCSDLEELLTLAEANPKSPMLMAKDLKRIDKAITVMKVGFKILKKALKKSKILRALPSLRRVS